MYFGTGVICGALAVIILWVIIFIDKKLDNNKKELEKVKIELSSLDKISDQDFYYIYFDKFIPTKISRPRLTSADVIVGRDFHLGSYYQIILFGFNGMEKIKSIEFDAKYYTKNDLKKIIERALENWVESK